MDLPIKLYNFYRRYRWNEHDFEGWQKGMVGLARGMFEGAFGAGVLSGLGADLSPGGLDFGVTAGGASSETGKLLPLPTGASGLSVTAPSSGVKLCLVVARPKLIDGDLIPKPTEIGVMVPLTQEQSAEIVVIDGSASGSPEYPDKQIDDVILFGLRVEAGMTDLTPYDIDFNVREIIGKGSDLQQTSGGSYDDRLLSYKSSTAVVSIKPSQQEPPRARLFTYVNNGRPSIFPKSSAGKYNGDAGDTTIDFNSGAIGGSDESSPDFIPVIPSASNAIVASIALAVNDELVVTYGSQGSREECLDGIKNQSTSGAGSISYTNGTRLIAFALLVSASDGLSISELDLFDARGINSIASDAIPIGTVGQLLVSNGASGTIWGANISQPHSMLGASVPTKTKSTTKPALDLTNNTNSIWFGHSNSAYNGILGAYSGGGSPFLGAYFYHSDVNNELRRSGTLNPVLMSFHPNGWLQLYTERNGATADEVWLPDNSNHNSTFHPDGVNMGSDIRGNTFNLNLYTGNDTTQRPSINMYRGSSFGLHLAVEGANNSTFSGSQANDGIVYAANNLWLGSVFNTYITSGSTYGIHARPSNGVFNILNPSGGFASLLVGDTSITTTSRVSLGSGSTSGSRPEITMTRGSPGGFHFLMGIADYAGSLISGSAENDTIISSAFGHSMHVYGGNMLRMISAGHMQLETGGVLSLPADIFANSLPTGSGTPLHLDSSNFLVRNTSSQRYKEDIVDYSDCDFVYEISPKKFKYKESRTKEDQVGLIAEELFEVAPDFVRLDSDKLPNSIDYGQLTVPLINLAKKHKAQIDAQRDEIDQLKQAVAELIARSGGGADA